jgi:DNA-directed RNA polymerase alpha subunit
MSINPFLFFLKVIFYNLLKSIKISDIKVFVSRKSFSSYQLLDRHSNLEEITEPIDTISCRLKSLNFKKINKKKDVKNIYMVKVNNPHEILASDIICSENLRVLTPEKKIFKLNSKKLKLLILVKLKM